MDKVSSPLCRLLRHLFLKKPTYTTAVRHLSLNKPTSAADGKFENLVNKFKKGSSSSSFRGNRLVFKATVSRLAKAGHFSYIHEIIDHQKQYPDIKNEHFTSRLICLYGQAKMLDHALQLFDEMPDLNCTRTVLSFNALMAACFPSENFNKAIELFRELPGKLSIEPNVISYTTVIIAFGKVGMLDKAVSMLEEMEKHDVNPNVITFNTLLAAFYRHGRFSEGENLWNLMREKKVIPDLKCYNSRMHGMANEKRLSEAIEVFEELKEQGLKPNNYTYNLLIRASVSEGNIEEAKKWYAMMLKSDYAPDFYTNMTLIPFACDNNDIDFAFELCKNSGGLQRKLSSKIWQKVIDKLVEHSKMEEAKELLELNNSRRGFVHDKLSLPSSTD